MIIALSGYAGSGKDTVAKYMTGYTRLSFAAPLKEALYRLNPEVTNINSKGRVPLKSVIDTIGWDRAKVEYKEVREYLQHLGTDVGRNLFGQDFWVDQAVKKIESQFVVFTDTRFPNEANIIRDTFSGLIVRVVRPSVGKVNDHISEVALDDFDFDYEILNDGTPAQLQLQVQRMLTKYEAMV